MATCCIEYLQMNNSHKIVTFDHSLVMFSLFISFYDVALNNAYVNAQMPRKLWCPEVLAVLPRCLLIANAPVYYNTHVK